MNNLEKLNAALTSARNKKKAAEEACAHWDYENDGEINGYDCCHDLFRAQETYRAALKAWKANLISTGSR